MAVYNTSGKRVADSALNVMIKDIKAEYPLYNDDQLLDAAIAVAKANGKTSKIIWDGTPVSFNGSTHVCFGFGGIDFNGSTITMPNYDNGNIIDIIPDDTSDITVSASSILKSKTTDNDLMGKIFTINTVSSGNSDMCLGYRYNDSSEITVYSVPVIKTSLNGHYETGDLYLTPENWDVECYNVHEYPSITFEVCNGVVVSSNTANMSTFVRCTRSNVHIHNFVLEGRSAITEFHWGIFNCMNCVDVEVDHISGTNPIQKANTSGYFLALSSVGFYHVHDIFVGDSLSWGVVGCRYLTNGVFERCYLNRWDCHFAQFGVNTIRNCVLNNFVYGLGNGIISVENCHLILSTTSATVQPIIYIRSDCAGVYDGDIIFKNCKFTSIAQPASLITIWSEVCMHKKPTNSKVSGSPKRSRIIESCQFPNGCYDIIKTGSSVSEDMEMFNNLMYELKNSVVDCVGAIVDAEAAGQSISCVVIDNCRANGQTLKTISCNLKVVGSDITNIASNVVIPNLVAVGNVFSGTQSTTNFTKYSLAGNIASDMASVNKHS